MARNVVVEQSSEFKVRAGEAVEHSIALVQEVFELMRPERSPLLGALSDARVLSRHRVGQDDRGRSRYRFTGFSEKGAMADWVEG